MLLEITRRCEPACAECALAGRDASGAAAGAASVDLDLDLDLLRDALPALRSLGVARLVLVGGEPIFHPRFGELVELICSAGYRLGLRTHGWRAAEYIAALARHREQLAFVALALPPGAAREPPPGSLPAADTVRAMAAIADYRAAGCQIVVDYLVEREDVDRLAALGERLAAFAVTLNLRAAVAASPAPAPWYANPEVRSSLIAQIQALKTILNERIALEPSLGVNHTYSFCSNFASMDRSLVRANGELAFCHLCPEADQGGTLGSLRSESPSAILARHPQRTGAIQSARLAVMASEPPAISNNYMFCQGILRSTPQPRAGG